jgi:hypothetical protein
LLCCIEFDPFFKCGLAKPRQSRQRPNQRLVGCFDDQDIFLVAGPETQPDLRQSGIEVGATRCTRQRLADQLADARQIETIPLRTLVIDLIEARGVVG